MTQSKGKRIDTSLFRFMQLLSGNKVLLGYPWGFLWFLKRNLCRLKLYVGKILGICLQICVSHTLLKHFLRIFYVGIGEVCIKLKVWLKKRIKIYTKMLIELNTLSKCVIFYQQKKLHFKKASIRYGNIIASSRIIKIRIIIN